MKPRLPHLLIPAFILCASVSNAQEIIDTAIDAQDMAQDGTPDFGAEATEERRPGEVPAMFRDDSLLDDNRSNAELGINVYTAPSITKIFAQLDTLPSIPEDYVLRERKEKLSTQAGILATEMGYLLADGFIAVRSGHMNDIKPIALELTRYGNALGVGEKMNAHSASLLEHAEKGQLEEFKRVLSSTQSDVNTELAALRDPDLAHLIALGGWIRALEASAAALNNAFDTEQAKVICYPDAPEYFCEILQGIHPRTVKRMPVEQMSAILTELVCLMTLQPEEQPTQEKVQQLLQKAGELSTLTVGKGYEH